MEFEVVDHAESPIGVLILQRRAAPVPGVRIVWPIGEPPHAIQLDTAYENQRSPRASIHRECIASSSAPVTHISTRGCAASTAGSLSSSCPGESTSTPSGRASAAGSTAIAGDETGEAGPNTYLAAPSLTAGVRIDRYLVIRGIGAGGMGVVYAAYDPELDRRVAIKLVRGDEHRNAPQRRERLLREARAMARLDHVNVIRVFDAGTATVDGVEQVFVAMELVEGAGLGAWVADRPQREVLAALIAAGRGLCAAHGAGLVHRDFKPDNVLVDRRDRVRVGDFAIAGAAGESTAGDDHDDAPPAPKLAVAGAVMGTPAFMAPEQHRGEAVDARADQFAFCVTAWLLLYKQHPFAADEAAVSRTRETGAELREAVFAGRIVPPPAVAPSWLEPLLRKGLAPAAGDRHRTLAELLDAIERGLRPRRWWLGVAGGAAVAAAIGGWLLLRPSGDEAACPSGTSLVAEVWGPAQQQALAARGPGGAATAAAVHRFAQSWSSAHDESCAARSRGEDAPAVLARRDRCLELSRAQIGAFVSRVTSGTDAVLARGPSIVEALLQPAACLHPRSDVDAPVPDDIALRTEVVRQRAELAVANAHVQDGLHAEADEILIQLSSSVAYPPVAAELAEVRADLADKRGDTARTIELYGEAIAAATAAGHDALAIGAIIDRAFNLDNAAEAARWYAFAEAMIARLGDPPGLRAHLYANRVKLHSEASDHTAAIADARRAYELRRAHDTPSYAVNTAINVVGALGNAGRFAEARDIAVTALADGDRLFNPDHHVLRTLLRQLVNLHMLLGDRAAARAVIDRLIPSRVRVYGADHAEVGEAECRLASLLGAEGKHAEAVAMVERALPKLVRAQGEHSFDVASARGLRSDQLHFVGRHAEADAESLRAIAALEKAVPAGHRILARMYTGRGFLLYLQRKLTEAETWLRRALAVEDKLPERTPLVAATHSTLAMVLAAQGRYAEARQHAERAIEIARRSDGLTEAHAEAEYALAQTLREIGDRAAATAAARRSLALYQKLDTPMPVRAEVEAFLAAFTTDLGCADREACATRPTR